MESMDERKNILVLAPHTDDGELGCGGTISRMIEEGHNVFYQAFSICEDSVPEGYPKNALEIEVKKATAELGIPAQNLLIKNYPVRHFPQYRQEILEDLVRLRAEIKPDIIFMPCSSSLHQDHITINNEGLRAFKHFTCYGYDLPWDAIRFVTTSFFRLEERHVKKKWEALKHYETQNFRSYVDEGFVMGLARVRGAQIATAYAEAFELLRVIY
jgi:LmbE family N-acetylglucosaminyl deacetylase